jgi:hypothetical protein
VASNIELTARLFPLKALSANAISYLSLVFIAISSVSSQGQSLTVHVSHAGFHHGWEQHEHQAGQDFIEPVVIEGLA